jgi:hypothetical protein
MSGTDRPRDAPDAAPDAPQPEGTAAGAGPGTVLTDARTRQEHALAYRATVDAVYAKAALHADARDTPAPALPAEVADRAPGRAVVLTRQERIEQGAAYCAVVEAFYRREAGRGNPEQLAEHLAVAVRHSADYVPAAHEPPRVDGPHEHPERWARAVNADEGLPGRDSNCGECARAVHSTWHGRPATAAAMADPDSGGESPARMAEWAGREPEPVTLAQVAVRLTELGPGSSAVVGCEWSPAGSGGHWFNAVNDAGTLKAADGQSGKVETWPPSAGGTGFEERWMEHSDALFFTPDGKAVQHDHS